MSFRIHHKVLCISDVGAPTGIGLVGVPEKGLTYTIRDIDEPVTGVVYLFLEEVGQERDKREFAFLSRHFVALEPQDGESGPQEKFRPARAA